MRIPESMLITEKRINNWNTRAGVCSQITERHLVNVEPVLELETHPLATITTAQTGSGRKLGCQIWGVGWNILMESRVFICMVLKCLPTDCLLTSRGKIVSRQWKNQTPSHLQPETEGQRAPSGVITLRRSHHHTWSVPARNVPPSSDHEEATDNPPPAKANALRVCFEERTIFFKDISVAIDLKRAKKMFPINGD